MNICEAIKEAYEKACLNKEKQNDGYDYVVPVSDKDGYIIFEVSSDGSLKGFYGYGWNANDFISNNWKVRK